MSVFPAFGMAEVAIGGSFPPPGRGLICDTVDRVVLERDRVAKPVTIEDPDDEAVTVRRIPFLGQPVPGLELRVVDPETFEDLPERHVGELLIRGTSVTPGYYKRPDATASLFHDGWLCTGDLAYLVDGELVALRADQGRHHRRRSQRLPGGHRARRRCRRPACAPAT